jgi:hypothetical protein
VAVTVGVSGAAVAQDGPNAFYRAQGDLWRDIYVGIGGQASRLGGGTLTSADFCGEGAYFDCGESAVFASRWGGGFRAELGVRTQWARLFMLFQGNYWSNVDATAILATPPPDFATIRANHRAYTLTFGAGLDSAVLLPTLLPPRWNIGLQGSLGPSWNILGDLRSSIFRGGDVASTVAAGGTHVSLAGEAGVFIQYALSSSAALQLGYASKWLGRFKTRASLEQTVTNGVPGTEAVAAVTTSRRRVDEIYLQITFRLGDLFR